MPITGAYNPSLTTIESFCTLVRFNRCQHPVVNYSGRYGQLTWMIPRISGLDSTRINTSVVYLLEQLYLENFVEGNIILFIIHQVCHPTTSYNGMFLDFITKKREVPQPHFKHAYQYQGLWLSCHWFYYFYMWRSIYYNYHVSCMYSLFIRK